MKKEKMREYAWEMEEYNYFFFEYEAMIRGRTN